MELKIEHCQCERFYKKGIPKLYKIPIFFKNIQIKYLFHTETIVRDDLKTNK